MPINWFVLRSKSNKEYALWNHVVNLGFETFYPALRVNPVNPRAQKIKPYFPGYLFVHLDFEMAFSSLFQWMPYSQGLVNFDGQPATVPEALIHNIRKQVELQSQENLAANRLHPGDRVVIRQGPLSGYEAVLDLRLSGEERVRVLLQLLSERQIAVEIPVSYIAKVSGQQGGSVYVKGGRPS